MNTKPELVDSMRDTIFNILNPGFSMDPRDRKLYEDAARVALRVLGVTESDEGAEMPRLYMGTASIDPDPVAKLKPKSDKDAANPVCVDCGAARHDHHPYSKITKCRNFNDVSQLSGALSHTNDSLSTSRGAEGGASTSSSLVDTERWARDKIYEARHVLMCYNVDHGDAEDLRDKVLAIIGERDG